MALALNATIGRTARPLVARAPRARPAPRGAALTSRALPDALLFDCARPFRSSAGRAWQPDARGAGDGVLVETERDGHRVSFNAAFKERGIPHEWDVPT